MEPINDKVFRSTLTKAFAENGIGGLLNMEKTDLFYRLTVRMLEENEKYNLTAIKEVDKIVLDHYADCAKLTEKLPKGAKTVDVGCGAGFPSLVLAILRPDLDILAVDSTAKRVEYVRATAEMLGLTNVKTLNARAEDLAKDPAYRERYDVATARAVSEMRVLTELCLPLVRVGGKMIAMKGKNAAFEAADAKRAIAVLGGKGAKVEGAPLKIPSGDEEQHAFVIVEKQTKTPAAYPRPYAQISKKPL